MNKLTSGSWGVGGQESPPAAWRLFLAITTQTQPRFQKPHSTPPTSSRKAVHAGSSTSLPCQPLIALSQRLNLHGTFCPAGLSHGLIQPPLCRVLCRRGRQHSHQPSAISCHELRLALYTVRQRQEPAISSPSPCASLSLSFLVCTIGR